MQEDRPCTEVTLIHGTWSNAEKSQWPALCSAIEKSVPRPVRFHYLSWSGHNSVRARYKGAICLQKHLESLSPVPGVRHYVVAHSHGGTVAALALKEKKLRCRVDGLVCLSTPFFHVRERDLEKMDATLFGAGLLTNALLFTWLTLHNSEWTVVSLISRSLLLLLGLVILVGFFSGIAVSIKKRMELCTLENVPVLVVRAPADDTTLPLTFFQFIGWAAQWVSWFFHKFAEIVMTVSNNLLGFGNHRNVESQGGGEPKESPPIDKNRSRLWWTVGSAGYSFACLIFAAYRYGDGISWSVIFFDFSPRLFFYTVLVGSTPILVAICTAAGLALMLYVLAAVVAAATSLLVGPELAVAGLFMEVSVESAPPGACDFVQLSMADCPPSELHHSTHSHPAAITYVASWLHALSERQVVLAATN